MHTRELCLCLLSFPGFMPSSLLASVPSFTGPPWPANAHLKIHLSSSLLPKLLSSQPLHTHLVQARPNVFFCEFLEAGHRVK